MKLDHALKTNLSEFEVPLFIIRKRLGEGFAPGPRHFRLLRPAEQLVYFHETFKALQLELAQGASD